MVPLLTLAAASFGASSLVPPLRAPAVPLCVSLPCLWLKRPRAPQQDTVAASTRPCLTDCLPVHAPLPA
jgi:hypothetical protein